MADPLTTLDITLQLLQAGSIIFAAATTIWGISAWRRETLGRRKIELAEETLSAFYQARDCIRQARAPLIMGGEVKSRTPVEGETPEEKSRRDALFAPAERLMNQSEVFAELGASSYRLAALLGEEARRPVTEILRVRHRVFVAVSMLIGRDRDRAMHGPEDEDAGTKKLYQNLQKDIGWASSKDDPLGDELDKAVADMEAICRPVLAGQKTFLQSLKARWQSPLTVKHA